MRYLPYLAWLHAVEHATGIDVETLKAKHVEPVAAINALRTGGGQPQSAVLKEDVTLGVVRLLVNMVLLAPFKGFADDRVAYETARAYAARRGFELDLGPRGMQLVTELSHGKLGVDEVTRAVRSGLNQRGNPSTRVRFNLQGIRACLSFSVTDRSDSLTAATETLEAELSKGLRRHGARVLGPVPQHRTTAAGEQVQLGHAHQGRGGARRISTGAIMTRSINRVTSSQVLIIIKDPRGDGSRVEREWALRCRIPIIELAFSPNVHPHSDAPRVPRIQVDAKRPGLALDRCFRLITSREWEYRDAQACSEAYEIKNELPLKQLRAGWRAQSGTDRDAISDTLGMSRPYMEGLLSNGVAIELASDQQLSGLQSMLGVANTRALATPGVLSTDETRWLTGAAERAGLGGYPMVRAVQTAGQHWRTSYQRAKLNSAEDADNSIGRAMAHLNRNEPGWND